MPKPTKPTNYRRLLEISADAKTIKGEPYGFLTGIVYLAPADSSGVVNVCPMAGRCKEPCLNKAGRGAFDSVQQARIAKTKFYHYHREDFLASLRYDIGRLIRRAKRLDMTPAVRINGTSDLPQVALQMAREFPAVQFYDYTKIPRPWNRALPNYHITFSYDGPENADSAMAALYHDVNVAVVFNTRKGQPLPGAWMGYPVIDGDLSDLRFKDPKGVIVGLRAKGPARKDHGGFVQNAEIPTTTVSVLRRGSGKTAETDVRVKFDVPVQRLGEQ